MLSLAVFIIILSVMIFVHEFGHFCQARRLGIRVEKFAFGLGPQLLSYKKADTEYALCLFAFGGFVKLAGDSRQECKGQPYEFLSRKPLDRAKVIFAGPALNYILAFFCLWLVNIVGYPNFTTKIGEVKAGYPGQEAGILKGDKVIAIDGKEVKYWPELLDIVSKKRAPFVKLDILRDTSIISLTVALRQEEIKNIFGTKEKVSRIGIGPDGESVLVKHNIFEAFLWAGKNLWYITKTTFIALTRIFTGVLPFKDSVTGPLGMFYITAQAVKGGLSAVLYLMAILSASLTIFNLLPLPVLDGGHILFLGLEKLRGRHIPENVEEKINQAGVAFIICLAVFIFLNDLDKFGVWEKIRSVFSR